MTKRMTKDEADRQRQLYAELGKAHPRAMVLMDQMKREGVFVRDYAGATLGGTSMDCDVAWDKVAEFVHRQICACDNHHREGLLKLTIGELASFYSRAAGGLHDPLGEDELSREDIASLLAGELEDLSEYALDDVVHYLASNIGSAVNNGGVYEQVLFMLEQGMTVDEIRKEVDDYETENG